MSRCKYIVLLATSLSLCSCGGDGGSSTALPADLKASISLSRFTIAEKPEPNSATLTVALSSSAQSDVIVGIAITGTATLGLDYEIEHQELRIAAGSSMSTTTITALRDFIQEGSETATFAIEHLHGEAVNDPDQAELVIEDSPVPTSSKLIDPIEGPRLTIEVSTVPNEGVIDVTTKVSNIGSELSPETHAVITVRPIEDSEQIVLRLPQIVVPEIAPGSSFGESLQVDAMDLEAGSSFILLAQVATVAGGDVPAYRNASAGFGLTGDHVTAVRCRTPQRDETDGADPLFPQQWPLVNTGQNAFAQQGGSVGADLNMLESIDSEPAVHEARVAVVDTGLEICHPDLSDNIETDASANLGDWPGTVANDPFNHDVRGDHGTSVGGIIGATKDNGRGIRGVHPHVLLRGYNYLLSDQNENHAKAHGASTSNPNSSDVDVFNMSYGQGGNVQSAHFHSTNQVFEHGVNSLRQGRGAIYVKSAGNGFNECSKIQHDIHEEIGCRGSNTDTNSNLPQIVLVGALSAFGTRAPYSSVGSNVWVSAPAGHYGREYPAVITTDQAGTDRGYEAYRRYLGRARGLDNDPANPDGDYVSTFNGTSAAAPHVSGLVALLLSEKPELTWRDIKYILARTAERVDADLPSVRVVISGTPVDFQLPWTRNAAGYWFHNWYGFGAVDVDAALELARNHPPDSLGETYRSHWYVNNIDLDIPDNDGSGIRIPISVTGIESDEKIEAVELRMSFEHDFPSDLGIVLTSPAGTKSVINAPFNDVLSFVYSVADWHQVSNGFYGESVTGAWELQVSDVEAEGIGTFSGWQIRFLTGDVPPVPP